MSVSSIPMSNVPAGTRTIGPGELPGSFGPSFRPAVAGDSIQHSTTKTAHGTNFLVNVGTRG
jgi:hypothetical protein